MSGDWSLNPTHGLDTPNSDVYDMDVMGIATSQLEAYLTVVSTVCQDVAGNSLVARSHANRIRMVSIHSVGIGGCCQLLTITYFLTGTDCSSI